MTVLDLLQTNAVVFYGVVAFAGLFVGSFLNVVIHRLPIMMENAWRAGIEELTAPAQDTSTGEPFNLSVPRSRCPECNKLITWWQNIPLLSYLFLRGRCHNCHKPISVRYPAIELMSMLGCLCVAWQLGPSWQTVIGIVVTWLLITMSMIDFDYQLLPDNLTLPMMWIGLLASLVPVFADVHSSVIGAAAGYLVLWLVYQAFRLVTGKEGMGFGDFKLLAAIGALLGWQVLPMVILLSSVVGAVVGITLIVIKGRDKNMPIPFGPYLASAGWITMLWGDTLGSWYYNLFG